MFRYRLRVGILGLVCALSLFTASPRARAQPLELIQVPIFPDDFENGDTCEWSSTVNTESPCTVSVEAIQLGNITGTVRLEGRFITAFTADRKHLWVADSLSATTYNGIFVFRGGGAAALPGEFLIGTPVDINGNTSEFDGTPPGDTLTELVASSEPVVAGSAGTPLPYTGATAAVLSSIADGEAYEGILVQIQNAKVNAVGSFDVLTLVDNFGGTLQMDDVAYDYATVTYPVGTCFATVTGVMTVNVIDDARRILPRAASDLVFGFSCN